MKILAVDDNPANLEIITLMLRSAGHEVDRATDGMSAVSAAFAQRPAIVFMDLAMPGEIDGLEATRRLKANPALADTKIVAVTAMVAQSDVNAAMDAGCDAFIPKPYLRKDLLGVIERFFSSARSSQ